MKPKVLGVNEILSKKYKVMENLEPWVIDSFGVLPDPFYLQIIGRPKNGKTSLVMKLVKSLAESGYTAFYNSKEEGDSSTIQNVYIRSKMHEVAGKVMLGDGFYFQDTMNYLKGPGKRKKIVVLDSLDYIRITKKQWIQLTETFPSKSFILVCWGKRSGNEFICDDYYGNQIKYMMGAITGVESHIARTIGRYGPTEPLALWPEKYPLPRHSAQGSLF